ncbi:MAG: hypothetical protein KAT70_01815 [Thermoplasmata archaeon]|nr:hypothetical protein [Thermoplasmata archaeon]
MGRKKEKERGEKRGWDKGEGPEEGAGSPQMIKCSMRHFPTSQYLYISLGPICNIYLRRSQIGGAFAR